MKISLLRGDNPLSVILPEPDAFTVVFSFSRNDTSILPPDRVTQVRTLMAMFDPSRPVWANLAILAQVARAMDLEVVSAELTDEERAQWEPVLFMMKGGKSPV